MENPLKLGSIAFIRSFEQKTTHSFMAPKSMSSEKENIELKRKKQHGQIEFVRTNCPAAYKLLIFNHLQAPGQKSRTNSICPYFYFNLITLTFLRSYTTLKQLSTITRQEVK